MRRTPRSFDYDLARVLLVDDDPASRITLKTVLEASGYHVESAASAAEATSKLEDGIYELVLSGLNLESPDAGLRVLAQARNMDYKPATALLKTYQNSAPSRKLSSILIKPEDVPGLLFKVAGLISDRATRRVERELRLAGV
jgi:CheY-like chemotaxis protein